MSWLEPLRIFRSAPDPRSTVEIEAQVNAEIEHHIECKERDLVGEGSTLEDARREARRLFGDPASIRRRCVWIQTGDRTMLQRIHFVVTLMLLVAVLVLAWSVHRSNKAAVEAAAVAQSFRAEREEMEKELRGSRKHFRPTKVIHHLCSIKF